MGIRFYNLNGFFVKKLAHGVTYYDHTRAAITLETGAKEPGMEDVTILDSEL